MKRLKSLLCTAIMLAMAGGALAADALGGSGNTVERERDQLQQKQETKPSPDDWLRTRRIGHVEQPEWGLSDAELLRQPEKLEKLLAIYLAHAQPKQAAHLAALYRQQHVYRDESLIEWAEAMSHSQTHLRRAIHEYRVLTGKFPDNRFIRYQLATLLYGNQQYDAAEGQFQKLRASADLSPQDVKVIDDYLNAIARKNKWHFGLGATFIRDKNLTDQAKVGTVWTLPNGATLSQNTPLQSGTGFNFNTQVSKQWGLQKGQYVGLDGSLNMKYYWNNKGFNEVSAYGGVSYGYADANVNVRVSPYVLKRFKAEGTDGSGQLHAYTHTFGTSLAADVWVSPKWKQSASYTFSREHYANDSIDKRHGGQNHSSGFSTVYYRNPKQYFGAGLNVSRFSAGSKTESYQRYGGRLFWGQEWPKGFVTRSGVGLNQREYKAPFLGLVKRKDKEWDGNVSLWHKAVHYKGITPRVTWNYYKRKSNIDIFSYDKHTFFIELDKNF